jgi:hypothetical protein|tara:strand:- start:2486 stop:3493 length:1008 start_codon:yes stop_codon:yes gene_type:complete
MATYKESIGTAVTNVAGDPPAPLEGQVWYNSSTGVFRVYRQDAAGAWATGGNLNSGRYYLSAATYGTQTAGLVFGGATDGTRTEAYNGSNWTEVNDLDKNKREAAGAGTQTSALCFGGKNPANDNGMDQTEKWNGTNWTEVNTLGQQRLGLQGAGASSTAALAFGGKAEPPSSAPSWRAETESYNGTNWTEVNNLNTARYHGAGAGTQTSALLFGGQSSADFSSATELWNGTNWTEVNDLSENKVVGAGCGASNTSALAFGGQPPAQAGRTESWNGSNWTTVGSLNVPRRNLTGAGTKTAALAVGGEPPGGPPDSPTSTEEFNSPALVTQTLTTS